jgi:hypothetical protein
MPVTFSNSPYTGLVWVDLEGYHIYILIAHRIGLQHGGAVHGNNVTT